jgi:hypothetical protein
VKESNTVYLRGHETSASQDLRDIASGRAEWNEGRQTYEIDGRLYSVDATGKSFPLTGDGMVNLNRIEYAALKAIARADGDLSAAPQLSKDPKFLENPEAVAKAKAIYDGTYRP